MTLSAPGTRGPCEQVPSSRRCTRPWRQTSCSVPGTGRGTLSADRQALSACHPAPLVSFTVPRPVLSFSVSLLLSLPHTLALMHTLTVGGEETTPDGEAGASMPLRDTSQWGGGPRGSGVRLDGLSQWGGGHGGVGCACMEGDGSRNPCCPHRGADGEERGWGVKEPRGGAGCPTKAEPILGARGFGNNGGASLGQRQPNTLITSGL